MLKCDKMDDTIEESQQESTREIRMPDHSHDLPEGDGKQRILSETP